MSHQPESLIERGFKYSGKIVGPDGQVIEHEDFNLIPIVGKKHLAQLILGTGAMIGNWYAFLISGDFSPTAATVAADIPASEYTGYSETARPKWNAVYDGDSSIDNLDSKITFTVPADKRIYGAGLVSVPTKGANNGTLFSVTRFSSPKDIPAGSTYTLGIGVSLVSG